MNQNWRFIKLSTAVYWCVIVTLGHWIVLSVMFFMLKFSELEVNAYRGEIAELKRDFNSLKTVGLDSDGNIVAKFKPFEEGEANE